MHRPHTGILLILISLFSVCPVSAQEEKGELYYDMGVFAFESGEYENALKYFESALKTGPDNPWYLQFAGKTLDRLARYDEALVQLKKAQNISPLLPGLKNDIALTYFNKEDFGTSAVLFAELSEKEPENILATYRAGISLFRMERYGEALDYLLRSSEKSPTVKPNALYYAAVCRYKSGDVRKSVENFEYVRDNAQDAVLKKNAVIWLDMIGEQEKKKRAWFLTLNLAREYDDNVRLVPDDEDTGADDSDWLTSLFVSGRYNYLNTSTFIPGIACTQYMNRYDDLGEYDMTVSMFNLGLTWLHYPFSAEIAWLPSFYRVDGDGYLNRHRLRTETGWHFSENLSVSVRYSYSDNDYRENDDKDGDTDEISLGGDWRIFGKKGRLSGSLAYEDVSASASDESFNRTGASLYFSMKLPWKLESEMQVRYSDKKYDSPDRIFRIKRNDDRYGGMVSLSRAVYKDRLVAGFTFDYTKNDSNILRYDYDRSIYSFFLRAGF